MLIGTNSLIIFNLFTTQKTYFFLKNKSNNNNNNDNNNDNNQAGLQQKYFPENFLEINTGITALQNALRKQRRI